MAGGFVVVLILRSGGDFGKNIQHVNFGHADFRHAIDEHGVAQLRQINPATTPCATRGGAEFHAFLPEHFARFVVQFCREWSAAHPRAIRLGDADDLADPLRGHAQASANPCCDGVARRDERIGAKINVEHTALRAFCEDSFAIRQRVVHEILAVYPREFAE